MQVSSFSTCPLCTAVVPRLLIQSHVNSCQGKPAKALGLAHNNGEVGRNESSNNGELDASSHNKTDDISHKVQVLQQRSEPILQPDSLEVAAISRQPQKPAAGNAFSALMAEQRERSKVVVLHLERSTDNTFQTYCWTKRPGANSPTDSNPASQAHSSKPPTQSLQCTPAVWSAQTQISSSVMQSCGTPASHSAASKVTLQLQTNMPSEAGGEAAQLVKAAPVATTFKGGASLLKSALQKNVRLCRPASAVR